MILDDPAKPEFATWRSYENFWRALFREPDYSSSEASRAFIATVLATCASRDMTIKVGTILYRAQLGYKEVEQEDEKSGLQVEFCAFSEKRMMPNPALVCAGRANRKGMAVLYLGSRIETVISEMRPWLRARMSVSQFRINRDLKVLNLTKGHGRFGIGELNWAQLFGEKEVSPATKLKAVWTEIDSAFSRPIQRGEEKNYLPTQILAESFQAHSYDGLVYRSNFGEPGHNVVIFNPNDAQICNGTPYDVTKITVEYSQAGNEWYKSDKAADADDKKT